MILVKRAHNIDLMKTLLVAGMILSHAFGLLSNKSYLASVIIKYVNLITFSGFMFIYGYNVYNAYIIKNKNIKIKNIVILLLSFWLCSMSYSYFIVQTYDINNYISILRLSKISGYAEFLVTFIVLELLILFFKKGLKTISDSNTYLVIAIIISLVFTIVPPVNKDIPYLNIFIKTNSISFPLIPYLNLFFLGIYFAKNKPKYNLKLSMTLAIFTAIHYSLDVFDYSPRMPISLTYVLGSYMFVYLYYYFTKYIYSRKRICNILNKINIIGKNSLYSLVISNIILFIIANIHGESTTNYTLLVYLLIMCLCYFLFSIKDRLKHK